MWKWKEAYGLYVWGIQTTAGNIALGVRLGKIPKSKLRGASKEMAKGMTLKELKNHSAEAKGKNLPKYRKGKNSILKKKGVELSKFA